MCQNYWSKKWKKRSKRSEKWAIVYLYSVRLENPPQWLQAIGGRRWVSGGHSTYWSDKEWAEERDASIVEKFSGGRTQKARADVRWYHKRTTVPEIAVSMRKIRSWNNRDQAVTPNCQKEDGTVSGQVSWSAKGPSLLRVMEMVNRTCVPKTL